MWLALDLNGRPVHWDPSWDRAVTWAMKQGGEMDVVFDPHWSDPDAVEPLGDVDIYGDVVG